MALIFFQYYMSTFLFILATNLLLALSQNFWLLAMSFWMIVLFRKLFLKMAFWSLLSYTWYPFENERTISRSRLHQNRNLDHIQALFTTLFFWMYFILLSTYLWTMFECFWFLLLLESKGTIRHTKALCIFRLGTEWCWAVFLMRPIFWDRASS